MERRIEPAERMTLADRITIGEGVRMSDGELLAVIAGVESLDRLAEACGGDFITLAGMDGDTIAKKGRLNKQQAARITAAVELMRRPRNTSASIPNIIRNNSDVVAVMSPEIAGKRQEELWALFLTGNGRLIEKRCVSVGGTAVVATDLKIIMGRAVELLATAMIVVHNHPSGNIEPGDDDKQFTSRLFEACRLFDIKFVDHVIMSPDCDKHYSFRAHNLL